MIPQASFTAASGFCSCALNANNQGGSYNWPEAVAGQTVSQMCQYGVLGENVTRFCSGQTWLEDASVCPTVVTKEFSELNLKIQNVSWCVFLLVWPCDILAFILLDIANQQTITAENVVNVTTQLETVVSQASEVVDQSPSNLAVVTTVISQISNISSPNAPVSNDVSTNYPKSCNVNPFLRPLSILLPY